MNENSVGKKRSSSFLVGIITVLAIVSVVEAFVILSLLNNNSRSNVAEVLSTETTNKSLFTTPKSPQSPSPAPQTSTYSLNKYYSFPIRSSQGETISEIDFDLKNYEFTNEVIVANRKATMVSGREVLVIKVDITNNFSRGFEILAQDYLRLSVNGEDKWVAPDIHDDPVEVRPNSTKSTSLGFPISETDDQLRLKVGEVNQEKEIIEISRNQI